MGRHDRIRQNQNKTRGFSKYNERAEAAKISGYRKNMFPEKIPTKPFLMFVYYFNPPNIFFHKKLRMMKLNTFPTWHINCLFMLA